MVCIGSKPLRRKGLKSVDSADMDEGESSYKRSKKNDKNNKSRGGQLCAAGGDGSYKQAEGKKTKNKRSRKQNLDVDGNGDSKKPSIKSQKPAKSGDSSKEPTKLRKKVDPETAKYFAEIAKLFESNEVDLEDRPSICANALEETRGREVELATDMIISHTLQTLLEGCDVEQLCGFLQNSAEEFPSIAVDKFGSHVAETALKSLAVHLQDDGSYSMIEDTLNKIGKVVVHEAVAVMCSQYGSHVLRSLLCLCKGVPLSTLEEFHGKKPHALLAERLRNRSQQSSGHDPNIFQCGFTGIFKFLVREMLDRAKDEITSLRVNNYSSFVLQATLKLLVGDEQELLHAVQVLLSCDDQGKFIEGVTKQDILALLEDTASSHLFEVIVEVAPEVMYNRLLNEVFKKSLFEISSQQCGNFVVQALVSSARTKDHVDLFWEELGPKLQKLLEIGKSGVVASVLAACRRFQTHVHECCQTLSAAVSLESESTSCIVPHILFLESYFRQKSHWMWPKGERMHTMGCLMLQTVFGCSNQVIQPYIVSIASMETDHIFETAKDSGGNHVLEAFLCSEASAKLKYEVIAKLQGHFGELSMYPSSSFTVEKCFSASNVPLKESIAAELLAVQADLSKTKHGPYLLKKLDIDGFARQPEQWKRSQKSKETVYREFQAAFESKAKEQTETSSKAAKRQKKHEKSEPLGVLDTAISTLSLGPEMPELGITTANMGLPGNKGGLKRKGDAHPTDAKDFSNKKFIRNFTNNTPFLNKGGPKRKIDAHVTAAADFSSKNFIRNSTNSTPFLRNSGKRNSPATELANMAGKPKLSSFEVDKLFKSTSDDKRKSGYESKPFLKKQKR